MATAVEAQAAAEFFGIGIRIRTDRGETVIQCTGKPEMYVAMEHVGSFDSGHYNPLIPREIFDVLYSGSTSAGVEKYHDVSKKGFNPSPNGSDGHVRNAALGADVTPAVAARRVVGPTGNDRPRQPAGAGNLKPVTVGSRPEVPQREKKTLQFGSSRKGIENSDVKGSDGVAKMASTMVMSSETHDNHTRQVANDGVRREMVQNSHALAGLQKTVACTHASGCSDVFICACCYEPADLEKITNINWDHPIKISALESCFPMKVKVSGRSLVGLIDENAECSVIAPLPWLKDERVQIMRGEINVENKIVSVEGIFNPLIQISKEIKTSIPVVVGELPENISIILGKNFLCKFQSSYAAGSDTYSFKLDGYLTVKGRAKLPSEAEWEILKVSEGNIGKLFKIHVAIDTLTLSAVLDLDAVRSVLNTKYCTDRGSLQPVKIKLRTANDSFLPVDGIYNPIIKIGDGKVQHPLVCAALPHDIPLLLGNDFLQKYKANISWEDESITLKIDGKIIRAERIKSPHEINEISDYGTEMVNCVNSKSENEHYAALRCTKSITIQPNHWEMVKGQFEKCVLPAVLSPCAVDGNLEVSSVECLLLDDTTVPVFNCSDEAIVLPPGVIIGHVRPENQNIEPSRLTETNMAELRYAVKNKLIHLDTEKNIESENCNVVSEDKVEPIPSLDGADLSEFQKERLRMLCRKFPEVFSLGMRACAPVPNYVGHLERTHQGTIYRRQWPLSARQKVIARKEIEKFLEVGVVEDGESVVTFPFFIVEKRGSTAENPIGRCLFDCRALNKVLVRPQYRSFTIADILSYCADKTLLCTLDINHYFFNIAVTDESKLLLGFTFEGRSLRWTRLPQGLAVSPPESLMALSKIMRGLEIRYYVDDLILGAKDFDSLLSLLEKLLERLRDLNLCVDPKKATLFRKELPIVGLIVKAGDYVKPNPERFKPLLALKNPKNAAQLKSVLAFFSYHRRYIRNFAVNTQRYQDMCNEKIPFEWTAKDANHIEEMYQYLLSNATLALFHEDLPAKLHCDASSKSLGAMVCQKHGERFKPVAYFSAPIKGTKISWSAFHKECLALYESVKYFENELRLLNKFTVVSDSTSLKYLLTMESPKAPFDKFISFLSQFCFDFEFVKSEKNKVPDALSRLDPPKDSDGMVEIPDSLITKLNDSLVSSVTEMGKERLEPDHSKINKALQNVALSCLPEPVINVNPLAEKIDLSPITSFRGKYYFLSNFYPVTIFYDNRDWPSVEHAFQAAKTENEFEKLEIKNADTALEAKRLDAERKLLETGERKLIEENLWHDDFWGVCVCSKHQGRYGRNVLGQLLCLLRDFKKDFGQLNPNVDDREEMVLVVTRSKAVEQGIKIAPISVQQAALRNIDPKASKQTEPNCSRSSEDDGVADDHSGGNEQGCVTSEAMQQGDLAASKDEKSDSRLIAAEVSKQAEAEMLGWRDEGLLNSERTIKHFSDDYYFLSTYSPSPFSVNGRKYLSVQDALDTNGFHFSKGELAYVSNQKNANSTLEKIRENLEKAALGTAVEFLSVCLAAKFSENPELKQKLIDTKGATLVYLNKCCQNVLGVCACTCCDEDKDIQPLNVLGVELMSLRSNFCREVELLNKSNAMEYVPALLKFIEYQRSDPDLAKIINTFDANGMPTAATESLHGQPHTVSLDAGPQSKSKEFLEYARKNGFRVISAASSAHWSVGRVESQVKRLASTLRFLVDGKMSRLKNWEKGNFPAGYQASVKCS
ncbi:Retrovirus-related Pol polyprotein from transposon 412 [Frankliniella fusca]|uniref:Retrovirus-related Pol polyprotein from transposon 412 n=1 Tax=Frankliniella fusca TaxID=407009 RepID=A0AAE1LFS9_9NEOP|nr:Retrovirus-related Pol polyprotein from transposon 412 [Frankliniella fusca]